MLRRYCFVCIAALAMVLGTIAFAQAPAAQTVSAPGDGKLRIIAIGAHPDDCDIRAGGTAAKWAAMGHHVKFVSVTNGDAGHQSEGGGALARRRRAEAQEAGRRLGVAYDVLDNHDGELVPSLDIRRQIIIKIREWKADVVLGPRPNDYHPDHRYTGVLLQDAAFMVTVPNIVPEVPALRDNPVFFFFQDGFQRPNPFRPDIVVSIDDTLDKKALALDAHVSQVYEWLPWLDHRLEQVPKDPRARLEWLRKGRFGGEISPAIREAAKKWYGPAAANIKAAEAFEICEYGRRPTEQDLKRIFPFAAIK
jgi:LmbE family N-acetylglucosaminyl deacetylase